MKRPTNPRGNPNIVEAGMKTRFQPGQPSANPLGRPRRPTPLTDRLKIRVELPLPDWWRGKLNREHHLELAKGATWADGLAAMELLRSFDDASFAREIGDRLDGKPLQGLRISGEPGGEPIEFSTMGGMTFDEKIEELQRRHFNSMTDEEQKVYMEEIKARIAEMTKMWRERWKKKQ